LKIILFVILFAAVNSGVMEYWSNGFEGEIVLTIHSSYYRIKYLENLQGMIIVTSQKVRDHHVIPAFAGMTNGLNKSLFPEVFEKLLIISLTT